MKVALMFRGIVRGEVLTENPLSNVTYSQDDVNWCVENIEILKETFKAKGHEVETFMFSWSTQNTKELLTKTEIDNVTLVRQPSYEEAGKLVPSYHISPGPTSNRIASYGQYMGWHTNLNMLKQTRRKYDYICFARPDVRIRISDVDTWMTDCLVMPNIETQPINDQIYIAPYEQLIKMSNITLESYVEEMPKHWNPEALLKYYFEERGIKFKLENNFTEYNLRGFKRR